MYLERCNRHAIEVLYLIRQKSVELESPEMPGTGHLLLSLIAYRAGYASRILDEFGLGYSKMNYIEQLVRKESPPGEMNDPSIIARMAELEDVLRISAAVAEVMGSKEIDTDHLLLAIFCTLVPAGTQNALVIVPDISRVAAQILRDLGITGPNIHRKVSKRTQVATLFTLN